MHHLQIPLFRGGLDLLGLSRMNVLMLHLLLHLLLQWLGRAKACQHKQN